jgi:hypothetical protein
LLLLLLFTVLARKVFRPGHDDNHHRRRYHQPPIEQNGNRGLSPELVDDERLRKVYRGVQQDN